MRTCNIPGYNMAEAFPTFKLYFLEDANEGVYYAFDNFFSYSSVMDIEIERPIDRPATLRLCMTNLPHLFNFKLFDNSTSGKWEASLYKWAIEPGGPDAVSLPSDANAIGIAGREGIGGAPFAMMGPDMMEGYAGGTKGKNKRIPLQYFPLQTGTKVQLRMGYTNNPDALFPVFAGIVTEIEPGDETITITAQSFLMELMTQLTDCAQTNSWGHLFPAYGGAGIKFTDTAENTTIISKMLKSSNARHFGHWQTRSFRPAPTKTPRTRAREEPATSQGVDARTSR